MNDTLFKIFVINYYSNLPKILDDIDIKPQMNGLMLCPMHDNYNTPAAKLFKDKTGWHFFCFAESRQYGAYDIYKTIYNYNMDLVFNQLWSSLTEADKDMMRDIFGDFDEETQLDNIEVYQEFKNGQINYTGLKNTLCNALK